MNKKIIFLFVISFFFLFLSYLPDIYEASLANKLPSDRVMAWGEHIYTYDFNVYLSKIRQGAEGRWSIVDKYDNNSQQKGVFLQMFYLLTGKIGSLLHLSPTLSYQLVRVIISVFWVLMIIYFNMFFLKRPALYIPGIILSLLASSWPIFSILDNQFWLRSYMAWWQEMDVVKRISFIPHDTLNYIVCAVLIWFFYLFIKTKNKKYFLALALVLFFSLFVQPSAGLLFLFSWGLYHLIKLAYRAYNQPQFFRVAVESLILIGVALVPLLYIRLVTSSYPWKSLTDFDQYHRLPFSVLEYLLVLGPVVISGFLGVILVLIKKEERFLPLATWVLGAFLAMFLFKYFPYQSGLRFVQTANHLPLSILTIYFANELVKKFKNTLLKFFVYFFIAATIALGAAQAYYSLKGQLHFIRQRAYATYPLVPYPSQVMHPLVDFYAGLKWLETNTGRSTVVLSKITAGSYIPAYSGNFVYLGHAGETPHYDNRVTQADRFFSGVMTDDDAYQFLKQENINFIFYGPQEKENASEDINRYPFLKLVFDQPLVKIYQVD